jgi:glycosyltransferase involved in cell wall biosynthesis
MAAAAAEAPNLVSVVIPVHNSEPYLKECLASVVAQTHRPIEVRSASRRTMAGPDADLQVVAFDDCSTDCSWDLLQSWKGASHEGISCTLLSWREAGQSCARGAGFARNRCVAAARGEWLCLLDSDDMMEPERVEKQLRAALELRGGSSRGDRYSVRCRSTPKLGQDTTLSLLSPGMTAASWLIGSQVTRFPPGSTNHYTAWLNGTSGPELWLQQYREIPIAQPTWFLRREEFFRAGGYPVELPMALAAELAAARPSAKRRKKREREDTDPLVLEEAFSRGLLRQRYPTIVGLDPDIFHPTRVDPRAAHVMAGTIVAFNQFSRNHFADKVKQALSCMKEAASSSKRVCASSSEASSATALGKWGRRLFVPEDLMFFHSFLAMGGLPARLNEPLLRYRCTTGSVSWNIPRRALLVVRVAAMEQREMGVPVPPETMLAHMHESSRKLFAEVGEATFDSPQSLAKGFTVWSCGRDGLQFVASLSSAARKLVRGFGDIDPTKLARGSVDCAAGSRPVVPVAAMEAPIVTCVPLHSEDGEFEARLQEWLDAHPTSSRGLDVWNLI